MNRTARLEQEILNIKDDIFKLNLYAGNPSKCKEIMDAQTKRMKALGIEPSNWTQVHIGEKEYEYKN